MCARLPRLPITRRSAPESVISSDRDPSSEPEAADGIVAELIKKRIDARGWVEQRVALPPAGVPVVVERPQTRRTDVAQTRYRQARPLGHVVLAPRRPSFNDRHRRRVLLALDANLIASGRCDALGAQFCVSAQHLPSGAPQIRDRRSRRKRFGRGVSPPRGRRSAGVDEACLLQAPTGDRHGLIGAQSRCEPAPSQLACHTTDVSGSTASNCNTTGRNGTLMIGTVCGGRGDGKPPPMQRAGGFFFQPGRGDHGLLVTLAS